MKFIRWGGLVAFISIISLILLFWYFFADNILKAVIENSASDVVEAEVSIAELDISFIPLGIEIKNLEVANARSPMNNTLQLDRAVAHMDLLKLLQGQIIIDSLAAEGLRFDTQRTRANNWKKKVEPPPQPKDENALFNMPDIQLQFPDMDDLLQNGNLVTTKMTKQVQSNYDEQVTKIELAFKEIPDLEKFAVYEAKVKEATSGKVSSLENYKQRKQALDSVHNQIRADQQAIKDAKTQLSKSKDVLAADIKALKAAPGQDLDNLKDKYKLDESGAANISKLLFGDQAGDLTTQGLFYYNKVKPLLESNKEEKRVRLVGRYVHFRSDNPTPDFLLRDAHIDVQLSFGHLLAKLQNVTHQMHITNKPATLTVRGTKLQKVKSVAIDGVFNHINPKHGSDLITFKVDDIDMGEMQLVKSSKLPIAITHANIDINGKILLNNGLQVYTDAQFDPVQFNSHADSTLGKMFAVAFTGIKSFYISGDISSDFKKHTIKIKSDMDDQIKQSLKDQWDTRIAAFRQKLRDKLDAEEQKIRGRVEAELAKLEAKKQDLEAKLARSEELLKAKVDEFKGQLDQKKDAAMDSLKNKLKR